MSEDRLQFTLGGMMGAVALIAGYFWLIRNPVIGAPLVCIGFPMVAAGVLLFVTIPRQIAGLTGSARPWWRPARRRPRPQESEVPPAPVPDQPFERFDPDPELDATDPDDR